MRSSSGSSSGFSIVELMIGMAVVAILAAIALPTFRAQVFMSRRAEAKLVLAGVGTSELAYHASNTEWVDADSNPGSSLTSALRDWDPGVSGWSLLGYEPDGKVRCNYMVNVYDDGIWARADSYCDVDNDNRSYIVRYYIPSGAPEQTYDGWREVDSNRF